MKKPRSKPSAAKREAMKNLAFKLNTTKIAREAQKDKRIKEGRSASQVGSKRAGKVRQRSI